MEKKKVNVNESVAKVFYDQCMGDYPGHMANIPNNPVLMSICVASGATNKKTFIEFLKQVADQLPDDDIF